jgi:hypothetical protein
LIKYSSKFFIAFYGMCNKFSHYHSLIAITRANQYFQYMDNKANIKLSKLCNSSSPEEEISQCLFSERRTIGFKTATFSRSFSPFIMFITHLMNWQILSTKEFLDESRLIYFSGSKTFSANQIHTISFHLSTQWIIKFLQYITVISEQINFFFIQSWKRLQSTNKYFL